MLLDHNGSEAAGTGVRRAAGPSTHEPAASHHDGCGPKAPMTQMPCSWPRVAPGMRVV